MANPGQSNIVRIENHGAGAVFLRGYGTGRLEVLVLNYTGRSGRGGLFTTLRVPFGTGEPGESVTATLRREMREEVAADPANFHIDVLTRQPVYWQVEPGDEAGGRTHLKAFYPARILRGTTRTTLMVDDAGTKAEERHGPPQWMEVRQLLELMRVQRSPRVHRLAVASTLLWAVERDGSLVRAYTDTTDWVRRALASFTPRHPVVDAYVGAGRVGGDR